MNTQKENPSSQIMLEMKEFRNTINDFNRLLDSFLSDEDISEDDLDFLNSLKTAGCDIRDRIDQFDTLDEKEKLILFEDVSQFSYLIESLNEEEIDFDDDDDFSDLFDEEDDDDYMDEELSEEFDEDDEDSLIVKLS